MLRCVSRYTSSLGSYVPGDEIDGPASLEADLMRDSAGSFEVIQAKAVESAPVDKMIRAKAATRKDVE
jgi:hypothetical protein